MKRKIMEDIELERRCQDQHWGVQDHPPEHWLAILTEEVGEVATAILEDYGTAYRNELVQVAAVAVAMIECYDNTRVTRLP